MSASVVGPASRFRVGERLRNVHAPYLPIAIVKEITPMGFKYELERPLVISPRLGTQTGGESYDDSQWESETSLRPKIIPKSSQSAIIPDRRAKALKRLDDIETELGRLDRSVAALKGMIISLKSDVLHLTDG